MDQLLPKAPFLHKQDPAHGGNVGHADTEMTEHYLHSTTPAPGWGLSTKQVIEKLKLLTDAEFVELEFSPD